MSDPYPNTQRSPLSTLITYPDWTHAFMTHTDAAPPRKARRRGLFAPFIIALIFVAAWCAGWFWLRIQAEQRMDAASASLKSRGYDLSWSARSFSGFPFRLNVTLADARVAEPSGWALRIPELKAEAMIYGLDHWVAVAPRGVLLTRPTGGDVAIAGTALRASLAGLKDHPPRVSIEGAGLVFSTAPDAAPFPLRSAQAMELHLRPGPDDQAAILFKAGSARVNFTGLLGRIAQENSADMTLDARLSRASILRGDNWADAVRDWSAAGGAITMENARITAGEAEGTAKSGALTVDADGRLQGKLEVALKERVDPKAARTPEQMLAAAAQALGREPVIEASLILQDGRTRLGTIDTGPSPRVY